MKSCFWRDRERILTLFTTIKEARVQRCEVVCIFSESTYSSLNKINVALSIKTNKCTLLDFSRCTKSHGRVN